MKLTTCLLILAMLLLSTPAQALVGGEAPAEDDTRYDAVGAFSRTAWLTETNNNEMEHNWFGAAVLIAPDVVLIARHLLPEGGRDPGRAGLFMVRFRRNADGTLGSQRGGPDSYHQVRVTQWIVADRYDLALGILEEPVEHIEPVTVLLDPIEFEDRACVLAGWGSESNWQGARGPRRGLKVGTNTVSSNNTMWVLGSYETERRENGQGQMANFIVDENAVPNMHDSGGSVFLLDEDGEPILMGIISSYRSGNYLAGVNAAGFPLQAATEGADALLEAVAEAE